MKVPTVGSVIKVRVSYSQGPQMVPPQDDFHEYEGKVLPSYKWLSDREFCLSGDDNWPIRVINVESVKDMKLISGELKDVKSAVETFVVVGSKGHKYTVTRSSKGWTCTCPGASFRGTCKHIEEHRNKNGQ